MSNVSRVAVSDSPEVKVCPRCGATLFADMMVCYGCLYDYARDPGAVGAAYMGDMPAAPPEPFSASAMGQATRPVTVSDMPAFLVDADPVGVDGLFTPDDTVDFGMSSLTRGYALHVVRGGFEAEFPIFPEGMTVGRDWTNDIVLPERGVSRYHLRIDPCDDGVIAKDCDATNPATVDGRPLLGDELVRPGETIELCGTLLRVLAC